MEMEIPEYVRNRLRTFYGLDAEEVLNEPEPMFGGKSAVRWIADSNGTWPQVLDRFEFRQIYGQDKILCALSS